jgi:hypothetical protein
MEQLKDSQKDFNPSHQTADSGLDFQYVVLKIEKLTAALHLVTSFLNNTDPIKYKLRDLALVVMASSQSLKYTDSKYKTVVLDDLKRQIDSLASFITVALTDSSVSQMNLTILQKEYRDLYNYLDRYQVNQESLVGKIEAPRVVPLPTVATVSTSPFLKSNPYNPISNTNDKPQPSLQTSVNIERRDLILTYIKAHGWSAINEIAKAVPGVGDKTVQRELAALVNEGILLKKGDRRWSRYNVI